MALIDKISADINAAMKSREQLRLETLRTLLAVLKEKVVEKRPHGGMTSEDEMHVDWGTSSLATPFDIHR